MNNKQKEIIEGFIKLKKFNKENILKGFNVTVGDYKTLTHYYSIQDKLDELINKEAGWTL